MVRLGISALAAFVLVGHLPQENTEATATGIGKLRSLPGDVRAKRTRELALAIRVLPDGLRKVQIASSLVNLATQGDSGPGTLQVVADTLTGAVKAFPVPVGNDVYTELANLARYEGIQVDLDSLDYKAALARVDALEGARAKADFTLTDRNGKTWARSALRGKVVVVNFWATWCPHCRKEMPDLDALSARFKERLVILGISDEKPETVDAYLSTPSATRFSSTQIARSTTSTRWTASRRTSSTTAMASWWPSRSICERWASSSSCSPKLA